MSDNENSSSSDFPVCPPAPHNTTEYIISLRLPVTLSEEYMGWRVPPPGIFDSDDTSAPEVSHGPHPDVQQSDNLARRSADEDDRQEKGDEEEEDDDVEIPLPDAEEMKEIARQEQEEEAEIPQPDVEEEKEIAQQDQEEEEDIPRPPAEKGGRTEEEEDGELEENKRFDG